MKLLFKSGIDRPDWWRRELQSRIPGLEVMIWPEAGNKAEIDYALVFNMPHGELATYPNLKGIFSLGAGVDYVMGDPDFPSHLPFSRVVDPDLTQRMKEYVVQHVLNHHRIQNIYDQQKNQKQWNDIFVPAATNRKVGILGMGELGATAANALHALGFKVAGWSRSKKDIDGIESFSGNEELAAFLARTEILVCLLPLTPATTDILNKNLFSKMPEGASLINAGRGLQLVENDLLEALDSGQISQATLDVFRTEPLPHDHPFWGHPDIRITPHNASVSDPARVADLVAENVRRIEAGRPILNQVDMDRGY
jgi:glyoxylate/hydroxypyruvate reductase